jgi:FkbM family methyltransferase
MSKLARAAVSRRHLTALIRHRVLAATEHSHVLGLRPSTVIDIGANRGQFALAARDLSPTARIISFEPLEAPAAIFRSVFNGDERTTLHQVAIGARQERRHMYISARDDSSSLLPGTQLQSTQYPGTHMTGSAEVAVCRLADVVSPETLERPTLLKIDVQGAESETLLGCETLLGYIDIVYCECSFVELYSGQKMAADIIDWLSTRSFKLVGLHNLDYDSNGRAVQGDFLFRRRT